jgi:hypothetical protein
MQRLFLFVAFAVVATLGCERIAQADPPSKRHLVYSFTVGVVSDQHAKDAAVQYNGMNASGGQPVFGTGDTSYKGNASDKGEITVDYLGIEADGGLVVNVAETARTNRTAASNTCVVYANTNVICGATNTNPEEYSILRTLSPRFFDPTALDANRHWKVNNESAGVSIDFIATPAGTGVVTIDSQRSVKSKSGDTTQATAKYAYELTRFLPDTIKEYTTMRLESGVGQYTNITIDVQANLTSDSLAANH